MQLKETGKKKKNILPLQALALVAPSNPDVVLSLRQALQVSV